MKRLVFAISLLSFAAMAHAEVSSAEAFAQQAGVIAGAAEACGQNVNLLNDRVTEALNVMVTEPTERARAIIAFRQTYASAKESEKASAKIPCDQVLKDYQALPILRADYKQTVLPSLSPATPNPAIGTEQAVTTSPANSLPQATQPTLPTLPSAQQNSLAPGATPAQQSNPGLQINPGMAPNNTQPTQQLPVTPSFPAANATN